MFNTREISILKRNSMPDTCCLLLKVGFITFSPTHIVEELEKVHEKCVPHTLRVPKNFPI